MKQLLRTLSQNVAPLLTTGTFPPLAFIDDLVLLVDSPVGLQQLINHTAAFLGECIMALNNAKSHTVVLFGHHGNTTAAASTTLNEPIRALKREGFWRFYALKTTALPEPYYHVAFGRMTISELSRVDQMLRATIEQ